MKCAGKKLHDVFFSDVPSKQKIGILQRFQVECTLLSQLRHPHVVQFLGICYERSDSNIPLLVMEYLPMTLAKCIERCVPNRLPDEVSYSILHEVALGLCYLHQQSPPIIHRDLSANNVLLTHDMTAKISDLGVAKILDLSPAKKTQNPLTTGPGTPIYMPPEAMATPPKYSTAVDVFSYGILILHIFSGKWPEPGEAVAPDPNNMEKLIAKSEVERREKYFQGIQLNHQLVDFTKRCLHYHPGKRPTDLEAIEVIEEHQALVPPTLNKVQLIEGMKELKATNSRLHAEIARLEKQLAREERVPLERVRSIAGSSLSGSEQSLTSDSGERTKLPSLSNPVHHIPSSEVNSTQHGEVVS